MNTAVHLSKKKRICSCRPPAAGPLVMIFHPFPSRGLLTAIISHFDRQLLGNKSSFAPCSMHILFDSNKFHKFWMSCVCRYPLSKDGRNRRKSRPPGTFRADQPDTFTYIGPILSLEQCDMFIRFQNKANISYPVGGPGRHKVQLKDPHVSAKFVKWETTHSRSKVEFCCATSVKRRAEGFRR